MPVNSDCSIICITERLKTYIIIIIIIESSKSMNHLYLAVFNLFIQRVQSSCRCFNIRTHHLQNNTVEGRRQQENNISH